MDLSLSEDQLFMRDEAKRFLAERATSEAVRASIAARGHDPALWKALSSELGWCGIAIPENAGGLALGAFEMVLLLEETGRRLAPVPFWATVSLCTPMINSVAADESRLALLSRVASDGVAATVALPRPAALDPFETIEFTAYPDGDGWKLSGFCPAVFNLMAADLVLVPAKLKDKPGLGLFAIEPAAIAATIAPLDAIDSTMPIASLRLSDVTVSGASRIDAGDIQTSSFVAPIEWARLGLAAEQIGAASGCLELTLNYLAERIQFGRSIASFQAVKHRCAELMIRTGEARSLLYGAAASLDADDNEAAREIDGASVLAAEALWRAAEEAIQLHGGVGNTWEYDPHLYLRRAQATAGLFGSKEEKLARIARQPPGGRSVSGEELTAFRAEVADWMKSNLSGCFAPLLDRGHAGDGDALPDLRKDWERELAKGGWTCPGWPSEHGGRGLSIAEQVAFQEEYSRAGGPGRLGHIGEGLLGPTLIAFGTEEQKQRFLPPIREGRQFWCQGYSEPDAGSDLANIKTRARRDPETGDWLVTGQKVWTSLAHLSDWIFVVARCEEGSVGPNGLIFLLMPLDQDGIEIHPIRQIGGGSEFNSVFFDNARANADCVVGQPGEGWKIAMALLSFERGISTLGQQMGFARELDLIATLARENGAAANPMIRDRLARAWVGLRAMRYMALRMLTQNADPQAKLESLGYKYQWSHWHRDLGKLGMDVLGFAGVAASDDPRAEKLRQLFFFTRADTVYGGTSEIQLNIIAERGLGMPKEPRGEAG